MRKRIFSILSVLLMLCVLTMSVNAVEIPDLDRTGSINIQMNYLGKPVSGGSLTIYRVAEIHLENDADYSFRLTEAYQDSQISLELIGDPQIALDLAAFARERNEAGTKLSIDKEGCVTFPELELGLYLVIQEKAPKGFNPVAPFLVSVPGKADGHYVYDVNASPKVALEPKPTEPTKPNDPSIPQTGQNNLPVPILATAGLALIVIGWIVIASGKKKDYEK